jgi:WD40 repeat protein
VAFSPDGKLLASGGRIPGLTPEGWHGRANVKVWDVATGQEVYTVWGPNSAVGPVYDVAFSPDGRYLASGSHQIILCDARTGKEVRTLDGAGSSLSFSPDGRFLAGVDGQSLTVWEVDAGRKCFAVTPNLNAATNRNNWKLISVAYSPDGRRLVTSGMTAQGDVRVWDATTGAELFTLRGLKEWADGVAWSPDGGRIAVGAWDRTVKVFDAGSGLELFELRGHTGPVQGVAFNSDGSMLASGGGEGTVRLWDATRGQGALTLSEGNHRIDGLALSPDGKRVGYAIGRFKFGDIKAVRVCAADAGRDILTVTDLAAARDDAVRNIVSISPGGGSLAVAIGNKVRLWDLAMGREGSPLEASGEIQRVVFSPAGNTVALVSGDKVTLRNLVDGQETLSVKVDHWGRGWTFSPDGSLAACIDQKSDALSVLEVASGKVVRAMQGRDGKPFHVSFISSLGFGADGQRLMLCDASSGDVFVWNVGNGQLLQAHEGLAGKQAQLSAFSPDGSRLATVSPEGKKVTLWDPTMGQQVFTLEGASANAYAGIRTLAWSADGSTLAAGDTAGSVWLWSAAPRTEEIQAARRAAWGDYALGWHRRAARDSERERHWFAASVHLSRVIEAGPADGSLYLRRGLANAQAERWAAAADDLGRAIELDRIDTFQTRFRQALLLRRKGDLPGNRRAVAFLLERWGNTKDAKVARQVLQAYLLDGEKAVERKSVERLVQVVLSANLVGVSFPAEDGIVPTEARTYAELRQLLNAADPKGEKRGYLSWLYAPLVCERLGDKYEAPFWLGQVARQIPDERRMLVEKIEGRIAKDANEEVSWEDVLALDLLQREIDALRKKAGR